MAAIGTRIKMLNRPVVYQFGTQHNKDRRRDCKLGDWTYGLELVLVLARKRKSLAALPAAAAEAHFSHFILQLVGSICIYRQDRKMDRDREEEARERERANNGCWGSWAPQGSKGQKEKKKRKKNDPSFSYFCSKNELSSNQGWTWCAMSTVK